MEENCGEREINTRMKIMEAGKDCHKGQNKIETLHWGLVCADGHEAERLKGRLVDIVGTALRA